MKSRRNFLLMFVCCVLPFLAAGFSTRPIQHIQNIQTVKIHKTNNNLPVTSLAAGLDDDNQIANSDEDDNFDGKGFANYLGPYALAFVASIAVTGAFVKFVLLDY
mmetsp:Transcript_46969/g.98531  ORF Transcript_46969/g.98531 Transcript_46969/m.98531 type:complete len:105 (+) Transcript_46969:154-468(+)|eukprot:CAMPEP_0183721738 /NCGR_PEP_ID=MMETSP0737-20130205/13918_1 /TAXON_ID=385413 /ORGANISM="Thalassiosira miniscula, Strain CCMP1093" /LENGTH=104 /DNA_ID=CAMNT_0025951787 /DNA_START=73 /DNA_END=387 /DNA_ORIENTATION=+